MSERLRGSSSRDLGVPERDFGSLRPYPYASSRTADFALQWCRVAATSNFPAFSDAGKTWFVTNFRFTIYNHAQEPNGEIPDAVNNSMDFGEGVTTARSWHRGGVNCLMADGSVRFISDAISRDVWRGLGTRYGAELLD